MKKTRILTNKEWAAIVDSVDKLFPKGECKERGKALVLIPKILLILNILPKEH